MSFTLLNDFWKMCRALYLTNTKSDCVCRVQVSDDICSTLCLSFLPLSIFPVCLFGSVCCLISFPPVKAHLFKGNNRLPTQTAIPAIKRFTKWLWLIIFSHCVCFFFVVFFPQGSHTKPGENFIKQPGGFWKYHLGFFCNH